MSIPNADLDTGLGLDRLWLSIFWQQRRLSIGIDTTWNRSSTFFATFVRSSDLWHLTTQMRISLTCMDGKAETLNKSTPPNTPSLRTTTMHLPRFSHLLTKSITPSTKTGYGHSTDQSFVTSRSFQQDWKAAMANWYWRWHKKMRSWSKNIGKVSRKYVKWLTRPSPTKNSERC